MSWIPAHRRAAWTALAAAAALTIAGSPAALAAARSPAHAAGPAHAAASGAHRACPPTTRQGMASCLVLIAGGVTAHPQAFFGRRAPTGVGYGPASLQSAYKLPSSTAGAGQKVAVIDAYNDPDAVANLATYRSAWGLPKCDAATEAGCLTVTNQKGKTSPLPPDAGSTGWATEESLDVDMVSAICPKCHIYLVEGDSPTVADLGTAVNSAVKVLGAHFVSNSYGAAESSSELGWDTKYYKHPGVAVTASAGDDGKGVSYPAASQYVTSVGGTDLTKAAGTTRGWKETAWSGSGYGCSAFEPEPSWQKPFKTGCTSARSDNDVAADADPATGVAIYDTYDQGGWLEVGGTSVSSPVIASVYALAGTPAAGTYPASDPYSHPSGLFDLSPTSNRYYQPVGLGSPDGTSSFA
jgi:subtilase family serine protease